MIRNRFTYDMADEVGLPFAPESRFLDLYANGEYLGTYQLSEKVDVGSDNLVKIEDLEGKPRKPLWRRQAATLLI